MKALQIVEMGDQRVPLLFENPAAAERLERDPDQGQAEQEEKPNADSLHTIIHGRSPVV